MRATRGKRILCQVDFVFRRHYDPAMFEPENLSRILGPEKYEYVLDRWDMLNINKILHDLILELSA